MLSGTLGLALESLAPEAGRFVDLFAGSGAVSRFVAERVDVPVIAVDLMRFSASITAATLERDRSLDAVGLYRRWANGAADYLRDRQDLVVAAAVLSAAHDDEEVYRARELCATSTDGGFIWSDYGGYYYSPVQALQLSAMYAALPKRAPHRTVALAALLRAASRASASPGHTAQPFRPTERLLPHLRSAWKVDIATEVQRQLNHLGPRPALRKGAVHTGDSVEFVTKNIRDGDLVFCDPPYSEAQYSRFYHVLEGIARGGWQQVSGAGRAPAGHERPSSEFSRRTRAVSATRRLLAELARKRTTVLWTYPEGDRSNGLTVEDIREAANESFVVKETRIPMRHSTLGGVASTSAAERGGRKDLHEVLFQLVSKAN